MRLIDADALLEKFEPEHYQDWYTPWILARINEAPTVEARPSGKWRKYEDIDCVEFIKCSVCGGIFYDGDNDTFDRPYNFCPNCGADMRGGKNET